MPDTAPSRRPVPTPARTHLLAGLAVAFLVAAGAAQGAPVALMCNVAKVTVSAPGEVQASRACAAAEAADTRLRALGLGIEDGVRIEITEALDVAPGICVALYDSATRTLQVLPLDCLDDQPGRAKTFPKMDAELLFDSLIVHELVHAYVDQSTEARHQSRIAHEYLAYAVQLEALPAAERARILAVADVGHPVDLQAINEVTLNFSPLRFAAMSWLHFRQEGGDATHVRRVVDGSLVFVNLRE